MKFSLKLALIILCFSPIVSCLTEHERIELIKEKELEILFLRNGQLDVNNKKISEYGWVKSHMKEIKFTLVSIAILGGAAYAASKFMDYYYPKTCPCHLHAYMAKLTKLKKSDICPLPPLSYEN
jgi:hypothetical protein